MEEIWKDIVGYEGLYQVSNLGNVRSLNFNHTGEVKNLKYSNLRNGYSIIRLHIKDKDKSILIHRLVALTFIPNIKNKLCVNHINGIKTDNRVENLEWCTYSENSKHRFKILGHKSVNLGKFGKDNHKSKQVLQYDLLGNNIGMFNGIREAERILGISRSGISDVCLGKRKTAGGFIWKYTL